MKTMKTLTLQRSYLDNVTLGKVFHRGDLLVHTVELPYLSNKPNISCIPPGMYSIHFHNTDKYPDTFVLKNHDLGIGINKGDSLRYSCCIHTANFPTDVMGCIGPGIDLHPNTYGVSESRLAMDVLRSLIGYNEDSEDTGWKLEIK